MGLLFALHHGLAPQISKTPLSLTPWTVAASIVVHGITAQPLMVRYTLWRRASSAGARPKGRPAT